MFDQLSQALRIATNIPDLHQAQLPKTVASSFADADLIVLEARGRALELKEEDALCIERRVQQGAALLVALPETHQLSSMRLGRILPSITWQTAGQTANVPPTGPATLGWEDREFFPTKLAANSSVPFYFPVEPMAAVERGQSRYARYQRNNPVLGNLVPAGDDFWMRPLLLRDVRVRLRVADHVETPILATARFGAGRTAVFGSGYAQLSALPEVLQAIVRWLEPIAVDGSMAMPSTRPSLTVETKGRSLLLHLNSASSCQVEVVGRAYTWESAPIGFEYDLRRLVHLDGTRPHTLQWDFPAASPQFYQAIDYRDAFRARIAVLSGEGALVLLDQQVIADFSAPVKVEVSSDDIASWTYPFHAPGSDFQRFCGYPVGARLSAYAYPNGATINCEIVVSNGLRDLGSLATVADETTPGNPSTASLLDGATLSNKGPSDGIEAYTAWSGRTDVPNVLHFAFQQPVRLASIALVGDRRAEAYSNPDAVVVEVDGRLCLSQRGIARRFSTEAGAVRLSVGPAMVKQVRLTLDAAAPPRGKKPSLLLTEVRLEGWTSTPLPQLSGPLTVNLVDVQTGNSSNVSNSLVSLAPGERRVVSCSFRLPESEGIRFFRIDANCGGAQASLPILGLTGQPALGPLDDLIPRDSPELGFIVTQGFRNCFPIGAGTAEKVAAWATPDDLIFAYSRQLKEVRADARTLASRLYVTEGDLRHYAQPWRTFGNGSDVFAEAAPGIVDQMSQRPQWATSSVARLSNSDRWESGPELVSLHGWQDFVAFDEHLRGTGRQPLAGRTRQEIAKEIHAQHEDEWQAWQLDRYLNNIRTIREAFAAKGRRLLITAQGCPAIAGAAGAEVAETVQGMSDDFVWGMAEASMSLTTGRQLAMSAHNPVWKMSTELHYYNDNPILDNAMWHAPAGTVEVTRRHHYDRAWRGILWNDGTYRSPYFAAYKGNCNLSYQMTQNDWNNFWLLEERHSLFAPEEPIGIGMVMSTIRFADPNHIRFSAASIFEGSPDAMEMARTFQRLSDVGLSISFAANAQTLSRWKGSAPLIILSPEVFAEDELRSLERLQRQGVRMAAFTVADPLPERAAQLFQEPGALIRMPLATLSAGQAEQMSQQLREILKPQLLFPSGVGGYGFRMQNTSFIVAENLMNEGRMVDIQLQTRSEAVLRAIAVNEHRPLDVQRNGEHCIIKLPLRPGDADLIAIFES
jgi:hypothetical protein